MIEQRVSLPKLQMVHGALSFEHRGLVVVSSFLFTTVIIHSKCFFVLVYEP